MKKLICTLTALTLICAALAGCASGLTFTTGAQDGVYRTYGTAIASIVSKNSDVSLTVRTSGGGKANVLALCDGQADVGIVSAGVAAYAYEGRELFAGEGIMDGFTAMAALYPEVVHIVAASGIDSIEKLAGKRVAVGIPDGVTQVDARHILAAYGMDFGDISVSYMTDSEAAAALSKKQIDAFFTTGSVPGPVVATLSSDVSFNLLPISEQAMTELLANYAYYNAYTIPSGTYDGVRADTAAVCVNQLLVASAKLPEEAAYSIVKALYENPASIALLHEKGELLDLSNAAQGLPIPLNAGAQRYFSETGVG